MSNSGVQSWIDPLDKITFKRATKAKQAEVIFRNGDVYSLEYRTFVDRLDGKKIRKVFVRPKGKYTFAPCGWYTIEKIL